MADTSYLRYTVEPHVRERLAEIHGVSFEAKTLRLTTGGVHEFDAVSKAGDVVCGIKALSLGYDGALKPGQFKNAISELYYLSLVAAPIRTLILTSRPFFDQFVQRIAGCIAPGVTIDCITLPAKMQNDVDAIFDIASREVRPETLRAAAEEELNA